jgi:hypothetical protein
MCCVQICSEHLLFFRFFGRLTLVLQGEFWRSIWLHSGSGGIALFGLWGITALRELEF